MDDIDAYLASKKPRAPADLARNEGPFRSGYSMPHADEEMDVDAYLKAKQQALHARKRDEALAKVAKLNAEPDPMSFGEIARETGTEIGNRLKGFGRGALTLGKAAMSPIDTLGDHSKRRELLRGVDDMVTWGYGGRLAKNIEGRLPEALRIGPTLESTEQGDAVAAPGYREAGGVAGMFTPGATAAVGKGALKVAGKAIPGAGAAMGAARGLGAAAVAAPTMAGLHASAEGDRLGAALGAATDLPGAVMAGAGGAAGAAVSDKIRKSRGYQAREFVEKEGQGARVGVTTPGRGGVFDDELAGVGVDDHAIGTAARKGAEGVLRGLKEKKRADADRPYREAKERVDASPQADEVVNVKSVVDHMKKAVSDLETDDAVVGKLKGKLEQLEAYKLDNGAYAVPERQLNGLRRSLMRMAKIGQSDNPGEKEAPLRAAAFAVKKMVDEGPYADANKLYATGAAAETASRRQLGLKPKKPADNAIDRRKLKLTLEREGQNTKTAGGDSDIPGFRAEHPRLDLQTKLAELARARADLAFRFAPKHGGLIDRTVGTTLGPAAALGAAAMGGPAGIGVAGGSLMGANASPIAGRLLAPMTQKSVNPLVWMAMEQKRRDAEDAARLRGGGP